MKTTNARAFSRLAFFALLAVFACEISWAGTQATPFDPVVDQLQDWAESGLGQVISLSAVIVGAIVSVVRSNPLPILSGIAFAMILNFTPGIVVNLLTGTI